MSRFPFCLLFLFACGGGSPPAISNLSIASASLAAGATTMGQLDISDPDGLDGLRLRLSFSGPASTQVEVDVQGGSSDLTAATTPFLFGVTAGSPEGTYTVSFVAIDDTDLESNVLTTSLEIVP